MHELEWSMYPRPPDMDVKPRRTLGRVCKALVGSVISTPLVGPVPGVQRESGDP